MKVSSFLPSHANTRLPVISHIYERAFLLEIFYAEHISCIFLHETFFNMHFEKITLGMTPHNAYMSSTA